VIGAGPAGITAAYELSKAGVAVEVFEAGAAVGGLARTIELWGQRVDLGPHRFFSADRRVNALWLEVVGRGYAMVDRLTRIFHGGRYFRYPLEPWSALATLGPREAVACAASYARERLRGPREIESFEDWVVARFGRRLFETFFRSYSEKLWGIPCAALDADFAAQRIRRLSLWEAAKGGLGLSGGAHRTLADRFAYPEGGTGVVYERMAAHVRRLGGEVHLGRPVARVAVERGAVQGVVLPGGEERRFDHVVSTMPLTHLVAGLEDAPAAVVRAAGELRFRNTLLVYLRIERADLFPDNWLYVQDPSLGVGRITNFRNWHHSLTQGDPATILALESWCGDEDPDWTAPDEALIARAARELRATGLDGGAPVAAGHVVRIRRCYPVYRRGYRDHVAAIRAHVEGIAGLHAIGRYGAFKYNNQDHSILMGILAARAIVRGERGLAWDVNADHDEYHEGTAIAETGLVVARA